MPKTFSISFHSGVRGRGFEVSSDLSCAGYEGNRAMSSVSLNTERRVGGLPIIADFFICSGAVAHKRKSKAASWLCEPFGIATSQLPISARPARSVFICLPDKNRAASPVWPGIVVKAILPTTFDLAGSLKALIHAGQLMD